MSLYLWIALIPWALVVILKLFFKPTPSEDRYEELPTPPVLRDVSEIQDKLDKIARAQR